MKKKKSKKSLKNTTKKKKISHKISLRKAVKKDFLEIDKYIHKGSKSVKKWKFRHGIPYWCVNKLGKIENNNYITSENTDLGDLKLLIAYEQVLVLTDRFR